MPDDHRALEPPDSIPNSEVKRCIADGSVGSPHVRVGHRQAFITKKARSEMIGPFLCPSFVGDRKIVPASSSVKRRLKADIGCFFIEQYFAGF